MEDRIHPSSMRELSMLIQLHGAARVRAAVDDIAARLDAENSQGGMFYTIQASDMGERFLKCLGNVWPVSDFIGRIQPRDVGKRVYRRGDILQVENDEQLQRRLAGSEAGR